MAGHAVCSPADPGEIAEREAQPAGGDERRVMARLGREVVESQRDWHIGPHREHPRRREYAIGNRIGSDGFERGVDVLGAVERDRV